MDQSPSVTVGTRADAALGDHRPTPRPFAPHVLACAEATHGLGQPRGARESLPAIVVFTEGDCCAVNPTPEQTGPSVLLRADVSAFDVRPGCVVTDRQRRPEGRTGRAGTADGGAVMSR